MDKILVGDIFDYLTVVELYNDKQALCQCVCGNKLLVDIDILNNKKNKKSCGCQVTKHQLPILYMLWKRLLISEKAEWKTWQEFVVWSKSKGFCEAFSYHKIDRKFPYNKDNLEFGLFINKKFFTIDILKKNGYSYNEKEKKFVTSKRIKNLIVNEDEITKALNKQKSKHKTLSKKLFIRLKEN